MPTPPVRLSPNFTSAEFACPCCGVFRVDMRLIGMLEALRTYLKKPLTITSGYRCEKQNAKEGGAKSSEHLRGMAADVACPKGVSLKQMVDACEVIGFGAIGAYPAGRGQNTDFVHVDVRAKKARWSRVDGAYLGIEEAFKPGAKKK